MVVHESHGMPFITYVLCAGFYPNILRVDHPPAVFKEVLGGAMESEGIPARLKFFDRSKGVHSLHSLLCADRRLYMPV